MSILWRHLRPHRGLVALTLLLAGLAEVLALVDLEERTSGETMGLLQKVHTDMSSRTLHEIPSGAPAPDEADAGRRDGH